MTPNASRIYNELIKFGSQYSPWSDVRHLGVMVWMMVGMIATESVNLTKWISRINTKALFAQSKQRQLSRWLNNPRINPAKLYSPVIKALLAKWEDAEIYLSFDTSQLWEEYCIIRLCVVHRGRALPLCWRVIKHRSSSVDISTYQDMLKRASKLLPINVKVIFLADRGFANPELLRYVRKLKWECRIRIKGNFWIHHPKHGWQTVKQLHLGLGEAKLIHNVKIHKTESKRLTDVHIAAAWESTSKEYWYILSTEPTTIQTFREYGLRFDIEENFLDDKSNGFDLESSRLRSAPAISRLCLVIAMTTLFLTAQGLAVTDSGYRRFVDPHWFRGLSYLKIGWNWVHTALTKNWDFFSSYFFTSNIDPDPAIASHKQHLYKLYRIEFSASTSNWAS
jgi:Transposase DDE domain